MNTKEKIEVMDTNQIAFKQQIKILEARIKALETSLTTLIYVSNNQIKPEPKEIWIRRFGRAYVVYEDEQEAIEDKTFDSSEPVKYREVLDDE